MFSGFFPNTFIATLQGPWINYFIDIANTYPYLWALYAIALVLPFVLCAACCVRTKVGAACVCVRACMHVCVCTCVCVHVNTPTYGSIGHVFSCQVHYTTAPLLCSKHMLFFNLILTTLMMLATPASYTLYHETQKC